MIRRTNLVHKFILARSTQQSQDFKNGEDQRRVAHQGRERRYKPIEIFGRDVSGLRNAVGAENQESLEFCREARRQNLF